MTTVFHARQNLPDMCFSCEHMICAEGSVFAECKIGQLDPRTCGEHAPRKGRNRIYNIVFEEDCYA